MGSSCGRCSVRRHNPRQGRLADVVESGHVGAGARAAARSGISAKIEYVGSWLNGIPVIEKKEVPDLPAHISETIQEMAKLHGLQHGTLSPLQRTVERLTALFGRPWAICTLFVAVGAWVILNSLQAAFGLQPTDPPPFVWLELAVSVLALFLVVLVLSTQRREDQLAQLREHLTLQLALLNEQKTAKVIELLEELRRDSPHLDDREDHEAGAMAQRADPHAVLSAIKQSHAAAEQGFSRRHKLSAQPPPSSKAPE